MDTAALVVKTKVSRECMQAHNKVYYKLGIQDIPSWLKHVLTRYILVLSVMLIDQERERERDCSQVNRMPYFGSQVIRL